MSKQGMARPDRTHVKPKNDAPPVPEIQGKAKHGKTPANPIISGTVGPDLKVFHNQRGRSSTSGNSPEHRDPNKKGERPISKAYRVVDNDLARDNMENDLPAADLEDL